MVQFMTYNYQNGSGFVYLRLVSCGYINVTGGERLRKTNDTINKPCTIILNNDILSFYKHTGEPCKHANFNDDFPVHIVINEPIVWRADTAKYQRDVGIRHRWYHRCTIYGRAGHPVMTRGWVVTVCGWFFGFCQIKIAVAGVIVEGKIVKSNSSKNTCSMSMLFNYDRNNSNVLHSKMESSVPSKSVNYYSYTFFVP